MSTPRPPLVNPTSVGFTDAYDGSDLVPGNVRALAAASVVLGDSEAALADTAAALAGLANALPWSGAAADAITAHIRRIVGAVDRWNEAHAAGLRAVGDHQAALSSAQDTAGQALVLWQAAHHQAAQAQRFESGSQLASNAVAVRSGIQAQLAAATRRAYALLDRARSDLRDAGDSAADVVEEALQLLLDTPLPEMRQGFAAASRTLQAGAEGNDDGRFGGTVTVQPPHDGVHDSLSRIAARTLGDADRWPQIYQLNVGRSVGDHAVLHNPNLIQPGWILRLPLGHISGRPPLPHHHPTPTPITPAPGAHVHPPTPTESPVLPHLPAPHTPVLAPPPTSAPAPSQPAPGTPGTGHTPHTTTPLPPTHAMPIPSPAHHPVSAATAIRHANGGGISLGDGVLLGGGVVAVLGGVAAALALHRHHTAGSHAQSEPGPVVRRLTPDLTALEPAGPIPSPTADRPSPGTDGRVDVPLGVREGQTILIDAATTLGLGITGPGAVPAVRAVLVSALAAHPDARVVLTADDLRTVMSTPEGASEPSGRASRHLTILSSTDAVLDYLETEILTRTRLLEETDSHSAPPLVAIIAAPADPRRLQAIADLGAALDIITVVLGVWPAGITCHISVDGRVDVAHTNRASDWIAALDGLCAFTAGADATRELLTLLDSRPSTPKPPPPTRPGIPPAGPTPADTSASKTAPTPSPCANCSPITTSRDEPARSGGDIVHRLAPESAELDQTGINARLAGATVLPGGTRTTAARPAGRTPSRELVLPVHLTVLGRPQAHFRCSAGEPVDITSAFTPRQWDILVYLTLHRTGVRRETLTAALWPHAPIDRPYNSIHAALSQMRRAVRNATDNNVGALTAARDGHYGLDPAIVDVDLWHLNETVDAFHGGGTEQERTAVLHTITQLYRGELAEGAVADWLEPHREALRRDVLDAVAALIRIVRDHDPEQALHLLEQARGLDPHNEAIYRDILRAQARLGHHDSLPRTLSLLRTALADIDAAPSAATMTLIDQLQRTTTSDDAHTPAPGHPRPT